MKKHKVKVGTQFRSHYADSNPLWTVCESRGEGVWIAKINEDDMDFGGVTRAFTTEEIQGAISLSEMWKKSGDDSDNFYNELKPGSIVHYHNGFGSYVRCQVTHDHQLVRIALVGSWQPYDLPRRNDDGTVDLGYHASQIVKGEKFRPHASNVFEYNLIRSQSQRPLSFDLKNDPRMMRPVSLDIPSMTKSEIVTANLWKQVYALRDILKTNESDPKLILEKVKEFINK